MENNAAAVDSGLGNLQLSRVGQDVQSTSGLTHRRSSRLVKIKTNVVRPRKALASSLAMQIGMAPPFAFRYYLTTRLISVMKSNDADQGSNCQQILRIAPLDIFNDTASQEPCWSMKPQKHRL
jgi:hypothetical protein